jgi:hypothetical protein
LFVYLCQNTSETITSFLKLYCNERGLVAYNTYTQTLIVKMNFLDLQKKQTKKAEPLLTLPSKYKQLFYSEIKTTKG